MDPLKKEFIALFELSAWSQAEAARQLHLTRGGVNGIITGKASVSKGLVELLRLKVAVLGKPLHGMVSVADESGMDARLSRLPACERAAALELMKVIIQHAEKRTKASSSRACKPSRSLDQVPLPEWMEQGHREAVKAAAPLPAQEPVAGPRRSPPRTSGKIP